jgi:hypothetical protein
MRWTRRCRVRMRSQGGESRERSKEARETSGSVADGEVVWSWHPLLMLNLAEAHSAQPGCEMPCNPRGDGGKRNSSPGRSRISRKTIAWGMPDVSGASAVNTRVHTYYPQRTRGCGCIGHPAFPAPSSILEGHESTSTRGMHRQRAAKPRLGFGVVTRSASDGWSYLHTTSRAPSCPVIASRLTTPGVSPGIATGKKCSVRP